MTPRRSSSYNRDSDFLVVLNAFNSIARYLEGVTFDTSETKRKYVMAEIDRINTLAEKTFTLD